MRKCCNRNNNLDNNWCNSRMNYNCGCNLYNTNNIIPRTSNYSCESEYDDCECGFSESGNEMFTQNPMFGHAYVPNQKMGEIFNKDCGLAHGTIFPELVSPYAPNDSVVEAEFLRANVIESGCKNNEL